MAPEGLYILLWFNNDVKVNITKLNDNKLNELIRSNIKMYVQRCADCKESLTDIRCRGALASRAETETDLVDVLCAEELSGFYGVVRVLFCEKKKLNIFIKK